MRYRFIVNEIEGISVMCFFKKRGFYEKKELYFE